MRRLWGQCRGGHFAPRRGQAVGEAVGAFLALAGAAAILVSVTAVSGAVAKIPGDVHCYGGVCHRVKTLAETQGLVGTTIDVVSSYYDAAGRDRHTPNTITSSGELFDAESPAAAASADLPDGTEILVWNLTNGRATHLRVNDFGPFAGGRTLDVTRRVSEDLGFQRTGTATLKVTVIAAPSPEETRYKAMRRYLPANGYIGVLNGREHAELAKSLIASADQRRLLVPVAPVQVAQEKPAAPVAGGAVADAGKPGAKPTAVAIASLATPAAIAPPVAPAPRPAEQPEAGPGIVQVVMPAGPAPASAGIPEPEAVPPKSAPAATVRVASVDPAPADPNRAVGEPIVASPAAEPVAVPSTPPAVRTEAVALGPSPTAPSAAPASDIESARTSPPQRVASVSAPPPPSPSPASASPPAARAPDAEAVVAEPAGPEPATYRAASEQLALLQPFDLTSPAALAMIGFMLATALLTGFLVGRPLGRRQAMANRAMDFSLARKSSVPISDLPPELAQVEPMDWPPREAEAVIEIVIPGLEAPAADAIGEIAPPAAAMGVTTLDTPRGLAAGLHANAPEVILPDAAVVAEDVEITGSIATPRNLHINGRVLGDARGLEVLVAPGGVVDGRILARTAVIAGRVTGGINAGHVRLLPGCVVEGDISTDTIEMLDGAVLEGSVLRRPAFAPDVIARWLEASVA